MKMKTVKAVAKRFSFTASGKIKYKRAGKRHNLGSRSRKNKLKLKAGGILFEGNRKHVAPNLPYGATK